MIPYRFSSVESTITSQLHKICISEKTHIQKGLEYIDTVTKVKQQNRDYYQNIQRTVQVTFKSLHLKYCNQDPNFPVSWGTFFPSNHFMFNTHLRKILRCVHLHSCWAFSAIIECAKKEDIALSLNDYQSFFDCLITDCVNNELAYVAWECSPDHQTICEHMKSKWKKLVSILKDAKDDVTVFSSI